MIGREKHIVSGTVVLIIDFDNVLGDYFNVSETENLIQAIDALIRFIHSESPADYYLIRLYGGWMTNGQLTNKASTVLQAIGAQSFFPFSINSKIIQGEIQLVYSLTNVDELIWENTYVKRRGLSNIRLEREVLDQHCNQDNSNCPAKLLSKFSRTLNKTCFVEGCSVVNSQAFIIGAQKMIDTMMATDIMDYSMNSNVASVNIFSDDTDLMPPVLRGHILSEGKVKLFVKNLELLSKYRFLNEQYGIDLKKFIL